MGTTVAIVLGAGSGVRANHGINKVYVGLAGTPIIVRSVRPFVDHPAVSETYVVAAPGEIELCTRTFVDAGCQVGGVLIGGPSRHMSEAIAVEHFAARILSGEVDVILVHDGARPIFDGGTLAPLVDRARAVGGAIYGLPVNEEIVGVVNGTAVGWRPNDGLWRAQTPQAFRADLLLTAFRRAKNDGFEGTDTAATVARAGGKVEVVMGDPRNIKITFPDDLVLADALAGPEGPEVLNAP
ncbi:MAG: 2-C-methyl-D-erythritol 4-phosphate cytidylyltransferase [Actinobacteria bacterium]|nr:2-C-methyl-D-erythritol 4-phosphate cytidylyltransferase [Actinomycetota bacterium]